MEIYKALEFYDSSYTLKLENGVFLAVFGDYALGSDGKTYYSITKVVTVYDEEYDFDDEEYIDLGWSADIKEPQIIYE